MKKENKKPNRTPIRIVKAFLFGMVSGMLLLEYLRNKKRPYLPCAECNSLNSNTEKTNRENKEEEAE